MKALVTGAGGFIGSHLTELLIKNDHTVTALVQYNSHGRKGWLDYIVPSNKERLDIVLGDVRDGFLVEKLIKENDYIFHLAALIAIPYSYLAPLSYVDTNIKGALNILEACRRYKKTLVLASSSEVYGSALYEPIDEKHPVQTQSPYSATKHSADSLAYSYFCSFGTDVVIARPFNTFGPRQSVRAIVPTVITQLLDGDNLELGNLVTERDLMYVKDTAACFLAAASGRAGEVYNFGTGIKQNIKQIAEHISVVMGKEDVKIICSASRMRPNNSEVKCLRCDFSKAMKELNWSPKYSFKDAILETVEWFRKNKHLYSSYFHV